MVNNDELQVRNASYQLWLDEWKNVGTMTLLSSMMRQVIMARHSWFKDTFQAAISSSKCVGGMALS